MRHALFTSVGLALGLFLLTPAPSYAQDDIVVTGTRISRATKLEKVGVAPGVTLVKRGDFLLLEVLM